jgi:hypothetical protein
VGHEVVWPGSFDATESRAHGLDPGARIRITLSQRGEFRLQLLRYFIRIRIGQLAVARAPGACQHHHDHRPLGYKK